MFFMTIFVTPRKWSKPIIAMVLKYGRAPPNWSVFVAFSTRYLMEHNANVATVGPANILRRRPEVNIYAAFRISKSVECVHYAFQK